jgi:hypothetical protein
LQCCRPFTTDAFFSCMFRRTNMENRMTQTVCEILQSGQGGVALVVDNYLYKMDKKPIENTQHWKCSIKPGCPGRVRTTVDHPPLFLTAKPHNHEPDLNELRVKRIKAELCKRAREHPHISLQTVQFLLWHQCFRTRFLVLTWAWFEGKDNFSMSAQYDFFCLLSLFKCSACFRVCLL